jgi:glutamate formiminotransferase
VRTLVECVPNFSEGRDKSKVDAIVEAMKMDGVYLLDREMDADHNRCVITLVGERESMMEAVLRGIGKAAEVIDLTKHQGAHPRMGATDVVPFIPLEGVTIEDCVQMARDVGEEIWKRYGIPVYLYEAAAQRPERQNLENIRRGQFEGIRDEICRQVGVKGTGSIGHGDRHTQRPGGIGCAALDHAVEELGIPRFHRLEAPRRHGLEDQVDRGALQVEQAVV